MFGGLLDALFPKRCAGCGAGPWPFCERCRLEVVALAPPWCERCGAPSARHVTSCRHCPPPAVDRARAPFLFEGAVRRAVHRLKFAGWRPVAEALGAAMSRAWEDRPDTITWVPLSRRRLSERGFDQARALAVEVARGLDLPLTELLRRVGDPGPQARRGGDARRRAMQGMFRVRAPVPPRVLVVDDVLTTGATAGACAEVLLEAGASDVGVLTAARAVSGVAPAGGAVSVVAPAAGAVAGTPAPSILGTGSRPGLWLPGGSSPGSRCQPRAKRPT